MNTNTAPALTPIPGTLECFNSRADAYGNRYYAFTFTASHGGSVSGTISGGESNVRSIMWELNGGSWEPRNVNFITRELPIRKYNALVQHWQYAGCTGEELAAFIRANLPAAPAPAPERKTKTVFVLSEGEEIDRGLAIAAALGLHHSREYPDRYDLANGYGTKTALGLYRVVEALVNPGSGD